MNEIKVFTNEAFGEIRTTTINDEPWFVGKDVALALGYKDTVNALKSHVDGEDKRGWQITTPSGIQEMVIINESGLYSLILSSKLPNAKQFKRWVTSEVLPSIRREGRYELKRHYRPTRPLTTDDYADAAKIIAKCHNSRLPIVIELYRKAGLEIPRIQEEVRAIENKTDPDWEKVKEILNNYTLREAAEKSGIPWTSIFYYRNGTRKPSEERCNIIINVLG